MIIFILGKQNSGKSLKAENLVEKIGDPQRIYVATMRVQDDAGRERVKKHVQQREGKGFETIEIPYGLKQIYPLLKDPEHTTVLIEDISNLVGNEMHDNPDRKELFEGEKKESVLEIEVEDEVDVESPDLSLLMWYSGESNAEPAEVLAEEIVDEIMWLDRRVHCVVLVSSEFDLSEEYDEETEEYIYTLYEVNDQIKEIADKVLS